MNEISLSNDLNVITAEINSYKQVAGQAIFEIGKRLKHVKENDLAHGEWTNYCNETLDMTIGYANRYIKVYEEFGDSNMYTSIGLNKLYQIATMPEGEREKEHTLSSGESKTVDEMTSRELEGVKRQLRETEQAKQQAEQRASEAERQAETARNSEQVAIKQMEEVEDREPEVKEVTKEVVPDNIKKTLEDAKKELNSINKENERLRKENNSFKTKKPDDFNEEQEERERRRLELEADKSVLRLKIKVDDFMKEVAINAFMEGAIASSGKTTKNKLHDSVEQMKSFANKMESALRGRIDIEGGKQ